MSPAVRLMPVLLVSNGRLVKTVRFKNPVYVGDPVNTLRIFNEIGVDEVVVLDISASRKNRGPDINLVREMAEECFMPFTYGGGVTSLQQIDDLLVSGVEKVALRTSLVAGPTLVTEGAQKFGSQAIVAAVDAVRTRSGEPDSLVGYRHRRTGIMPAILAANAQSMGAGEIFLTSVDAEGSWRGFDFDLIRDVSEAVTIPLVAHGGGGSKEDVLSLACSSLVSGVALGSMSVFQNRGKGVLVNFPDFNFNPHYCSEKES